MSPSRASLQAFSRLIDAAAQPIYVVDDEATLRMANFALTEWCGRSAEELQGQACRYHSAAPRGSLEAIAAALCPPPEALAGERRRARLGLAAGEQLDHRWAEFLPLLSADGAVVGVLVVVAPSAAEEADDGSAAAPDAHARLREFHHRWPGTRLARWVGGSPAARRIQEQIALASGSDVDVLIVGPAGSGREHVAHSIHEPRVAGGARPLVVLPGAEASLERMRGAIEAAAGRGPAPQPAGALLIRDVDRLSDDLQFALLEALSISPRRYRVLATARAALAELVAGGFRADLAHRLAILTIEVPSLRQRREDLPLLAQAFVEERNAQGGKQVAGFTAEALEAMAGYPWPGELDELREFVRHAHEAAEGPRIAAMHWPAVVRIAASTPAKKPRGAIVLGQYLEQVERELIEGALSAARGNKAKAARQLGMTRPRLYRRMVQLGLAEPAPQETIEFMLAPSPEDLDETDGTGGG